MSNPTHILGVDIGGTGTKGGIVDVKNGALITERYKFPTPQPATPDNIASTFAQLVSYFDWKGPIGVGFPSVVIDGVTHTAANLHESCIGSNMGAHFSNISQGPVYLLNDADAAGLAEMHFGAGKDSHRGTCLMVTIGTGIGSALFHNGQLVPNTELGHTFMENGYKSEKFASGKALQEQGLTLQEWVVRLNAFLQYMERLFWPRRIILGGGLSKSWDEYAHLIECRTPVVCATFQSHAGTIGAALGAYLESAIRD